MEQSEGLRNFLGYSRRMLVFMGGACLAVAVGLLVLVPGDHAWIGGFATGAIAQLLKFGIIDIGVVKRIAADPDSTPIQKLISRYGGLAVLLLMVIITLKFRFNAWALGAGIFLPRVILLADTYLRPNMFALSSSVALGEDKEA